MKEDLYKNETLVRYGIKLMKKEEDPGRLLKEEYERGMAKGKMTELKVYDNDELHELLLEFEAANVDPVKVLSEYRKAHSDDFGDDSEGERSGS